MNEEELVQYQKLKDEFEIIYNSGFPTLETFYKMKDLGDRIFNFKVDMKEKYEHYSDIYECQMLDWFLDCHDSFLNRYIAYVVIQNVSNDVDTCMDMLSQMNGYSIGSHMCGLNNHIMSKPEELANSILTQGLLSARGEGGGIAENVHILGSQNTPEKLKDMIEKFYISALYRDNGGVVVAIPEVMLNSEGKEVFVGKFPEDLDFIAKDDSRITFLPLNQYVRDTRCLPPEFIMGVVSKNEDGSASFHKNERFISLLSVDEQIAFYNQLVEKGFHPDSHDVFSR